VQRASAVGLFVPRAEPDLRGQHANQHVDNTACREPPAGEPSQPTAGRGLTPRRFDAAIRSLHSHDSHRHLFTTTAGQVAWRFTVSQAARGRGGNQRYEHGPSPAPITAVVRWDAAPGARVRSSSPRNDARRLATAGPRPSRKQGRRALKRELGLASCQPRPWRPCTTRQGAAGPVPDLVNRDFSAAAPGEKMVGDIICIPTWRGWLYLATVIDCATFMPRLRSSASTGQPIQHGKRRSKTQYATSSSGVVGRVVTRHSGTGLRKRSTTSTRTSSSWHEIMQI
jgi:hypothetical protein